MTSTTRIRAVLGLQKRNFPDLLARGKAIFNAISASPSTFPKPNPPLPVLQARLIALDQAQQVAETRAKGAAAARDVVAGELITCLETQRAYVQETADASPDKAVAIVEAAAMFVGQPPNRQKPILEAAQDKPSGPVHVKANVGALTAGLTGKVFFNWQMSSDGGASWNAAPPTPHGHTDFDGLQALHTYGFRVSVTGAKGMGSWSQAVTLLVL